MRPFASHLLALSAVCTVACSGAKLSESNDAGPGGSDASTLDASKDSDASVTGSSCPADVPAQGASCSTPGLSCEYGGTGDRLLCSTIASCQPAAGAPPQWSVRAPSADCVTSQAKNPLGCPSSFGALPTGGACPREAAQECVYPEGTCGCVPCSADAGAQVSNEWACAAWPTPASCPEPRPRLGSACNTEGLSCAYTTVCGVRNDQPYMVCQNERWAIQPLGVDCPIRWCGQ